MNITSSGKQFVYKKAGYNLRVVLIASISMAIIAFTAYAVIAANMPSTGMMDTSEVLSVSSDQKTINNFKPNPYLRTKAENQLAQRYQAFLVQNPELKILNLTSSNPVQRTQAELRFSQRYQTPLDLNSELKIINLTSNDPLQRSQAELQFAQRYGK